MTTCLRKPLPKWNNSDRKSLVFDATDEELLKHYLAKKALEGISAELAFPELDSNNCDPWDIPDEARMGSNEWYFFSHKGQKYARGTKTNRTTTMGFWKQTGYGENILDQDRSQVLGRKKRLVFYRGRHPNEERTNWVMHEYSLDDGNPQNGKGGWVMCRMILKAVGMKKKRNVSGKKSSPPAQKRIKANHDTSNSLSFRIDSVNHQKTSGCVQGDTCTCHDSSNDNDSNDSCHRLMRHGLQETTCPLQEMGLFDPNVQNILLSNPRTMDAVAPVVQSGFIMPLSNCSHGVDAMEVNDGNLKSEEIGNGIFESNFYQPYMNLLMQPPSGSFSFGENINSGKEMSNLRSNSGGVQMASYCNNNGKQAIEKINTVSQNNVSQGILGETLSSPIFNISSNPRGQGDSSLGSEYFFEFRKAFE